LNPLRQRDDPAPQPETSSRDALFRLAMARGIDPATVDPEQLATLLGLKAGDVGTTGRN
jgi:hypothetical protein